jgi:hypothetical protein
MTQICVPVRDAARRQHEHALLVAEDRLAVPRTWRALSPLSRCLELRELALSRCPVGWRAVAAHPPDLIF